MTLSLSFSHALFLSVPLSFFLLVESNNIFGRIPDELFTSTSISSSLTKLNLGHNSITGTIPSTIGLLTKLTYLNLGYNNLVGTIPTNSMMNLTTSSLETLILCSNTQLRYVDNNDDLNFLCNNSGNNDANDGNILEILIDCDEGPANFVDNCDCCRCCQ